MSEPVDYQKAYKKLLEQVQKKKEEEDSRRQSDTQIICRVQKWLGKMFQLMKEGEFKLVYSHIKQFQFIKECQTNYSDDYKKLLEQLQKARLQYEKQKWQKKKKIIKWTLFVISCLVVTGLVITTCVYGVPAFLTWLSLTWSSFWITAFNVCLDIVIAAIGGFVCKGVKKAYDYLFA